MQTASKLGNRVGSRKSMTNMRVLVMRRPAYKWHEFHTGSFLQLRDPPFGLPIETSQVLRGARTKVEMVKGGSDSFIVAVKTSNVVGAKGWGWIRHVCVNRKEGTQSDVKGF